MKKNRAEYGIFEKQNNTGAADILLTRNGIYIAWLHISPKGTVDAIHPFKYPVDPEVTDADTLIGFMGLNEASKILDGRGLL